MNEFDRLTHIVEQSLKKKGNITITLLHLSNMLQLAKRQCENEREGEDNEKNIC